MRIGRMRVIVAMAVIMMVAMYVVCMRRRPDCRLEIADAGFMPST